MGILNYLQFDDVKSSDFGIYISGEGTFNAPERRGEMVNIAGRNGGFFMDEGVFKNIEVTYPAFNYEPDLATFRQKLATFRNALNAKSGYMRLTDTFHPDEFRLAVFRDAFEVKPVMYNTASELDITFDCKPQRFLVSGETPTTFTASGTITNPEKFASSPLLEIVGNGLVTIGDYSFEVSANTGTVYVDADIMEAYSISGGVLVPENGNIVYTNHKPPKIDPGTVSVTLGAGITSVKITPRWWRL